MTNFISKSRFAAGLQCEKLLWWKTHETEAPVSGQNPSAQFIEDEEQRVVQVARSAFPDGFLIDFPEEMIQERVEATEMALAREEPAIFQATFFEEGVVVSVDILARKGRGHSLIEVKPDTSIKPHHLWEVAVQAYVLRRAGVDVDSVEIMHLNEKCRFPGMDDLFVVESISGRVRGLYPQLSEIISKQVAVLSGTLPDTPVGDHCDKPTSCPFKDRCWPAQPKHHVETFYGLRREKSAQLEAQELTKVADVPSSFPLTQIQQRQQRSVMEGELQVEDSLVGALAPFQGRVAYLDFQTVPLSIPVWVGLGPWQNHPVQFGCQIALPNGELKHHEWLADGPEDSRAVMAQALLETLEGVDVVVTYDKGAQKKCLEAIAAAVPEQAREIMAISSKTLDLLPVVRDHVYHPDFLGSFSLTAVLPPLVPSLGYESLEVSGGLSTEALLHRLLFSGNSQTPDELQTLRQKLQSACALDTMALVRLKERLAELAEAQS